MTDEEQARAYKSLYKHACQQRDELMRLLNELRPTPPKDKYYILEKDRVPTIDDQVRAIYGKSLDELRAMGPWEYGSGEWWRVSEGAMLEPIESVRVYLNKADLCPMRCYHDHSDWHRIPLKRCPTVTFVQDPKGTWYQRSDGTFAPCATYSGRIPGGDHYRRVEG